eukprot:1185157-Prorocentrum_minimum.AAC.4
MVYSTVDSRRRSTVESKSNAFLPVDSGACLVCYLPDPHSERRCVVYESNKQGADVVVLLMAVTNHIPDGAHGGEYGPREDRQALLVYLQYT